MPSTAPLAFPPAARGSSWPAVSDEVRELDRAMGYLRRDHDPVAALAALDHYLDRYPHGSLHPEARQARIDALLMLGRNQQALAELEATSFDRGLRSTELLVVRAELRAAEDCLRAERDFTAALARSPDARLTERILYGRGVCRIKMQDTAAANDDVRSYLRRYPNGAHGDWARRWLASQCATEGER
jgi:TolA-binding protein